MLAIAVITVSDRAFKGEYPDQSGPKIREIIENYFPDVRIKSLVVADEPKQIEKAIWDNLDKDYIITTGGTGISPRDVTPDVCRQICERDIPGIAEMLRTESLKETPYAVFSRNYAGIKGRTIVINLPGSVKAVDLCTCLLMPLLEHGKSMLAGLGH